MASDQANQEALVAQLPELVLDLYLHYRVPPETPKPKPRKKTPAKGKKRK
jgi:uncharacterized protein